MSGSYLVIPSALIHVEGLASLDLLEHRLYWKIIGLASAAVDLPDDVCMRNGAMLTVPTSTLLEDGEDKVLRLLDRLKTIRAITFTANLDRRDTIDLWRLGMGLIGEYEVKDETVSLWIGPAMFNAIRHRAAFTRVTEASLFAMRGSKYSSRLYVLIRDKMNLRVPKWEVSLAEFRTLMQVKEGQYPAFDSLRYRVIDPAVSELNKESELTVTSSKGHTYKNKVRTLVFEWKLKDDADLVKTAKESARHSSAKGKKQEDSDAPPMIITQRAVAYLSLLPALARETWYKRAVALGAPAIKASTSSANLNKWAGWVARMMVNEGLISDQPDQPAPEESKGPSPKAKPSAPESKAPPHKPQPDHTSKKFKRPTYVEDDADSRPEVVKRAMHWLQCQAIPEQLDFWFERSFYLGAPPNTKIGKIDDWLIPSVARAIVDCEDYKADMD